MIKIRLKITPSLGSYFDTASSDWILLEKEVREGGSVQDLLGGLASEYKAFRESIFDPDLGQILQRVMIVLNDRLLQFPEMKDTPLKDGDSVILLPVYTGG